MKFLLRKREVELVLRALNHYEQELANLNSPSEDDTIELSDVCSLQEDINDKKNEK